MNETPRRRARQACWIRRIHREAPSTIRPPINAANAARENTAPNGDMGLKVKSGVNGS
jgi:hypothetical protein